MKLVVVVWEDASVVDDATWVSRTDTPAPKAVIFHQVGWLYTIDSESVVLTSAVSDHLISARDRIPTGMVKSIVEIEPNLGKKVPIPRRKK